MSAYVSLFACLQLIDTYGWMAGRAARLIQILELSVGYVICLCKSKTSDTTFVEFTFVVLTLCCRRHCSRTELYTKQQSPVDVSCGRCTGCSDGQCTAHWYGCLYLLQMQMLMHLVLSVCLSVSHICVITYESLHQETSFLIHREYLGQSCI